MDQHAGSRLVAREVKSPRHQGCAQVGVACAAPVVEAEALASQCGNRCSLGWLWEPTARKNARVDRLAR